MHSGSNTSVVMWNLSWLYVSANQWSVTQILWYPSCSQHLRPFSPPLLTSVICIDHFHLNPTSHVFSLCWSVPPLYNSNETITMKLEALNTISFLIESPWKDNSCCYKAVQLTVLKWTDLPLSVTLITMYLQTCVTFRIIYHGCLYPGGGTVAMHHLLGEIWYPLGNPFLFLTTSLAQGSGEDFVFGSLWWIDLLSREGKSERQLSVTHHLQCTCSYSGNVVCFMHLLSLPWLAWKPSFAF